MRSIDARVSNGAMRITVGGVGVYVLDLEGRPLFFEHEFRSYQRGLSGLLVRKSWDGSRRVVEEVRGPRRDELLGDVYGAVREALEMAQGDVREALEMAYGRWPGWLRTDEELFARLYMPISILPPDQYLSIVLQAVEGCAYNRCSFCYFYKGRPYRAKGAGEFEAHAKDVRTWLGSGIEVRRNVFISDANPLGAPREMALDYFRITSRVFPEDSGIYTFSDYFSTKLSPSDYSELRELGLRRVYVGLESGSRDVLKVLMKPPDPEMAIRMARGLRDAGISRGIIILIGAGGKSLSRGHVDDTLGMLSRMDLGPDDIVFLSRLVVKEGSRYALLVKDGLSQAEMDEQEEEIKRSLSGVKVAAYNIVESIY